MNGSELDARTAQVERLVQLFKPERMVYLAVTIISLAVLLVIAAKEIHTGQTTDAALMFGSSGVIAITANRLLTMYNNALKIIFARPGTGND